jgi:UDP-N-acetylglucosamine--N-acetylmuramyl-(pentapeptide) pyrophosphoryl-undecaprenol N-acetylglucosamine transferase
MIPLKKVIISGGGTGGHIFPAVAIGMEIKKRFPNAEILFVGATGGMEMELVPKSGFPIKGVWISGIHRQINWNNIKRNSLFPLKFISSIYQSYKIIEDFKPEVVIGVGGYASGPLGRVAGWKNIPLFICEANAYPGLTNKWLASKAKKILLGNADALKYFDKSKCVITGNPIRKLNLIDRNEAAIKLGLNPDKPIVLSLGGSWGAKKINSAIEKGIDDIVKADIQWIWQCGKQYFGELSSKIPKHQNLQLKAFIDDMALAYSAADVIISRAGASTISELIALEKVSILVPSPNVAEDHQTKNALSLVNANAALLVKDVDAENQLVSSAIDLLKNGRKLAELRENLAKMEKYEAGEEILAVISEQLSVNS